MNEKQIEALTRAITKALTESGLVPGGGGSCEARSQSDKPCAAAVVICVCGQGACESAT